MNRFAHLLDRLAYEPGRNNKLRLITGHFRTVPDPERGWALAALTGSLSFPHAKPGLIRALISERVDPVLFEWSWDYVGDLAENGRTHLADARCANAIKQSAAASLRSDCRPRHPRQK